MAEEQKDGGDVENLTGSNGFVQNLTNACKPSVSFAMSETTKLVNGGKLPREEMFSEQYSVPSPRTQSESLNISSRGSFPPFTSFVVSLMAKKTLGLQAFVKFCTKPLLPVKFCTSPRLSAPQPSLRALVSMYFFSTSRFWVSNLNNRSAEMKPAISKWQRATIGTQRVHDARPERSQ
jgi:hypothetical protein